uniref:DNA-binding transcriptional activator GcvA n=2 Tax=Mycobacterium riyadhense TaxID=486698 RepID=A0A653EZ82_9MYCO|nr:DNA-binding transcriptional activator GcvA [Mycobacterium riyadhense]
MNAVRTLPIRLKPIPGEAIDSWLEALAHRNHTVQADLLAAVRPATDQRHPSIQNRWVIQMYAQETRAVSAATGIDQAAITAMTLSHYAERALRIDPKTQTISRTFPWGRGRGSRYCPHCLAETGGRWQLAWRLGWSFACLRHRCLLADTCPACGRAQRIFAHIGDAIPAPGRCALPRRDATGRAPARCGANLANRTVPTFSDDNLVLTAQQLIYNLMDTDRATFGVYRNNGVPSVDALADIRAVAARVLSYATHEDLENVIPADLLAAHRNLGLQLAQRSGRNGDKPGLCAPAHAATTAVGVTAALTSLTAQDVAAAGQAMHWLVRSGRQRGLTVCPTKIGWSHRVTPTLVAVQLTSLEPFLQLTDQLRYRIAAPVPSQPSPGKSRIDRLVHATPTMFWPAWSLRLAVAGCRHRYLRRVLSAAVLMVGTRLRLPQAAELVSPGMPGQDVSRVLQWMQANAMWEAVRAALTHCADHLADGDTRIDYHRRRKLDYRSLLPDDKWVTICREAGVAAPTRRTSLSARGFLFEQISGLPARAAPFAVDSWEFRSKVADFPRHLTPELNTAMRSHAEEFLAVHHIDDEPVVWHPPTDVLDALHIGGLNPAGVDVRELHRLIRPERHSVAEAAKRLHTASDVIRYVLELHPAPVPPPPIRHPHPCSPRPRKPRPAQAYQTARLKLTRDEFIRRYEQEHLTLQDIAARVGVSRGVVTRLAHDYGIPIRKRNNQEGAVIDRDWLHQQYMIHRRSIPDIARQCGLSDSTVAQWARIFGIPLRPKGGASHVKTFDERQVAERSPALLQPALAEVGGWERLQRFAAAARYPTLTLAANDLGLPQGRLVVQIKRIEHDLGHQLIVRAERGRPMQLTAMGNRVARAVEKVRSRER